MNYESYMTPSQIETAHMLLKDLGLPVTINELFTVIADITGRYGATIEIIEKAQPMIISPKLAV